MNTRRSDTVTFKPRADAFLKQVEATLNSEQTETLYEILVNYNSMLICDLVVQALDDFCVLEQIKYIIQDYPQLLKSINTLLPRSFDLNQVFQFSPHRNTSPSLCDYKYFQLIYASKGTLKWRVKSRYSSKTMKARR